MKWFWLSFADGDLPEGERFLGVVVQDVIPKDVELFLEMDSKMRLLRDRGQEDDMPFYAAVILTHTRGTNPGGAVQGAEIPEDWVEEHIPKVWRGKLLSEEKLKELGIETA